MPATQFICPDNYKVDIGTCLAGCRMGRRCLTLPTLITLAASERPWNGKPSTTMMLNGPMVEYLKTKYEYAINPRERAYALLGSEHHERLAAISGDWIAEQRVGGAQTGTPDLVEPDELIPGGHILTDYKTYGSFRVAKMLGLTKKTRKHPTEVYKSSGKWGKRGDPKTVTYFEIDPNLIDQNSEELQLNHYRTLLEAQGLTITHMQIQVTVRDGGLQIARQRGVDAPIYLIPIRRLDDTYIQDYFQSRGNAIIEAISEDKEPRLCNEEESWDKRKCKDYCDVASLCQQGKAVLSGEIRV